MGSKKNDYGVYTIKFLLNNGGKWSKMPVHLTNALGYGGREKEELNPADLIHPHNRAEISENLDKLKEGEIPEFNYQLHMLKKSGESVSVHLSAVLIRDPKGNPDYISCFFFNFTEHHELKQELEKSRQQFESLFRNNPHPVYYFDRDGNFRGVNDRLLEFTGLSRQELLGMNFEVFIAENDLDRTKKYFRRAAEGKAGEYEIKVIVKEGEQREIRVTKFPMIVGNEVVGVFGIFQDITREKTALEELEKSEQRWQQLVEQNPQPVQIVQNGKIVFLNRAGAEYYGASSPEQLYGKSILDFTHPEYMENALGRKKKLEQNEPVAPDEHKILLLNGEERYIEAHSIPISYNGRNAIQTVVHDITNLKEKQEVIGKSLREKEVLLQEIHHRVKNNLAIISSMLELQILQSGEGPVSDTLRNSQLRIQSMAMIHEKLYQSESLNNIGFEGYLKELVGAIKNTFHSADKSVETEFSIDTVSLSINQAIPCSLIVNEVIVNCYKHAFCKGDKGKIEISVRYEDPMLHLSIVDNGKGLPDNFTVDGQQSMGMTLIHALASQLEGQVSFRRGSNGKGTAFQFRFEKNHDSIGS